VVVLPVAGASIRFTTSASGTVKQKWDIKPHIAFRRRAASALHDAWVKLINRQPRDVDRSGTVQALRETNVASHVLFAECVCLVDTSMATRQARHSRVVALEGMVKSRTLPRLPAIHSLPLGQPDSFQRIFVNERRFASSYNVKNGDTMKK
jgi:hypothetical protein